MHSDPTLLRAVELVLGQPAAVPCRLDRVQVKRAYRRRAQEVHPDKARTLAISEAVLRRRFQELQAAYCLLLERLDETPVLTVSPRRPQPWGPMAWASGPAVRRPPAPAPAARSARARTAAGSGTRPAPGAPQRPPSDHGRAPADPGVQIPRRAMRFAEYLCYARVIGVRTLVNAVVWQMQQRPRLGQIASSLSYLTPDQVVDVLRRRELHERFGEAALRLGLLESYELLALLGHQIRYGYPIGRYFVEHGLLSQAELDTHLRRHWFHNAVWR